MAATLTTESGVKAGRGDYWKVLPEDIVVDPNLNARGPVLPESNVLDLMQSINASGQQTPVTVRKLPDNRVKLVLGYCRVEAVRRLNAQNGTQRPVFCMMAPDMNDSEAFERGVIENFHRENPDAIQNAVSIRRLIQEHGRTEKQVAALYNRSEAWVGEQLVLLNLPNETRDRVRPGGDIGAAGAKVLAKSPAEAVPAIIREAEKSPKRGGKITREAIVQAARKVAPASIKTPRSIKEIDSFFESLDGPEAPDGFKAISKGYRVYRANKCGDRSFRNAIEAVLR